MFTAYITDKAGFALLCRLMGGDTAHIPNRLLDEVTESNYQSVLKRLCDVGYAHEAGSHIDIEKTMNFLVSSVLDADNVTEENGGKRVVFRCKRLIVIIEEDRLSPKKCRIIPIKDEAMLGEYYNEYGDNASNFEEEQE